MFDDNYAELIQNPTLIDSHELSLKIMDYLNASIASIDGQLDAYSILAGNRHLRNEEEVWVRKACYALAMKKRDLGKVYLRDKELRHIKGTVQTQKSPEEKEANLLKQQRLKLETEDRKIRRQLELEKIHLERLRVEQKVKEYRVLLANLPPRHSTDEIENNPQLIPTCE